MNATALPSVILVLSVAGVPKPAATNTSSRQMICRPYDQWCVRKWTAGEGLPPGKIIHIDLDEKGRIWCQTQQTAVRLDGNAWHHLDRVPLLTPPALPTNLPGTLPWQPPACVAKSPKGRLWVGTARGLCLWDAHRWRAFHGKRWLPDDHVNAVTVAADGSAWVATDAGVAHVYTQRMTLADKADHFLKILRARHVRRGLVGKIVFEQPGHLDKYHQPSDDNDGLWTALYVAAESFRYAATGAPDAKANATESVRAMLLLEEVTSLPGFVARSYVARGQGPKHGGIWYPSKDGKWDWKGDTSSDEIDGHFLAYAIYHDLVDDEETRQRVADTARRIMDRIIDGGFKYHGPNGRRTRWGVWAPHELNETLEWRGERGLNSLSLLTYLEVTRHLTGDEKYRRIACELIDKHHYAKNTVNQKINIPGITNHSDDELAFVNYYNLLRLEKDPEIRKIYVESITRSWRIERPEHSPLFNFIYGSAAAGPFDLPVSVEWLQDFPMDLVYWEVDNRGRKDVEVNPIRDRFKQPQSKAVLPPSERPLMRWNGNPYALRGGSADGRVEDDGTIWLLPYWMGRHHGFIVEKR
ncbi:MAG: hypothetical protein JXQ73_32020 [Phycisphaerae bacterium]|nr:hypothetical protein [Phycisphaerae bacterium]